MKHSKPVIGIIGGIASGKSYIASLFGRLGCGVIDADAIVERLYENSAALRAKLASLFGENAVVEGKVNRAFIGEQVFTDKGKLALLNEAVHPLVIEQIRERRDEILNDKSSKAVIYDVPLLLEAGLDGDCDAIVFVDCDERVRELRFKERDGFTEKEHARREKGQIFLDKKRKIANYIINNNSFDMGALERVDRILSEILQNL
ncbi:MAG: dephospho-CoA kinase [Phycisphaerae bacterium]